ncbi:MAG: S9 family peptidase [Bdellovibrionales bacterium]|nr:S9 family peptidase [Bdellovibrionales bacterium]
MIRGIELLGGHGVGLKLTRVLMICGLVSAVVGCSTSELARKDDSYMWLEEVEGEKALAWVREQNRVSLSYLEMAPQYRGFEAEAQKILLSDDRIPYGQLRNGSIYNFWQDKKSVRGVWRRTRLAEFKKENPDWEVLLDVDQLAEKEKENWVFKGVSCLPPEYERCMVTLSRGGKDASVVREFNLKTREFVRDGFVIPEGKTWWSWFDQNTLLVGTDFGPGTLTQSGYPMEQRIWKRGTPLLEAKVLFRGEKSDVGVWAYRSFRPEGQALIVSRSITFFESKNFYVKPNMELVEIPIPADAELQGLFQGEMLVQTKSDWRIKGARGQEQMVAAGSLVSFSAEAFLRSGKIEEVRKIFEPSKRVSLQEASTSQDALFFSVLDNVKAKIYRGKFRGNRWRVQGVAIPDHGSASVVSANDFTTDILINYQSFTIPNRLYLSRDGSRFPQVIRSLPNQFESGNLNVEQLEAVSKDGTKVPYFVIGPKERRPDGQNKTLLYGYGGFETSMTPHYLGVTGKIWSEPGNVYVIANIRGGGEFGPGWHKAAQKENRQRAFDDFIAVAEDLIRRKITIPSHLGIMGGSNGGLLVGAVFVQRPELFGAVVCQVPLLDMLRYSQLLAGASWVGEYGDPADPQMRKVLEGYSPFHNVTAEKSYPEVFFITSTKDDRVHPGHARKMVAKMKDLGHPVLYFENIEGGHSASANLQQRARRTALEYVYLDRTLGKTTPK